MRTIPFIQNNLCSLKRLSLVIVVLLLNVFCSNAQRAIGFTGGYSLGTFFNFSKDQYYDATYHFKSGAAFSFFYEDKISPITNLKIGLQYNLQYADLKIDMDQGHGSFYKDMDYSFHLLNLNFSTSFKLAEKESFKLRFLLGFNFAYNINTLAKGNGWDYHSITQTDTNGKPVSILTTKNWEKDEKNSKDLSTFNIGIDAGLEFIIPINNRFDFLVQNRYTIFLTNFTTLRKLRHTSLFIGNVNVGFRYKFKK